MYILIGDHDYSHSPEEKIKLLEKKINELIEESCFAASRNEHQLVSNVSEYAEILIVVNFYSRQKT